MDLQEWRNKIQDYYAGTLNVSDRAALLSLLEGLSDADLNRLFPQEEWAGINPVPVADTEIEMMLKKIRAKDTAKVVRIDTRVRKIRIWRVAAIILVVLTAGLLALLLNTSNHPKNELAVVHYHEIKVADGNRKRLTLPDSSVIVLNGGSVASVPDRFTGSSREIYLREGEAWFEVTKNPLRPFIIHSSSLNVRVLGTSFSVRDYPDEQHASVAVRTGRVAVQSESDSMRSIVLVPGKGTEWDKISHTLSAQVIDTATIDAWRRGEFIFENATLKHICNVLKHRYAVQFRTEDQQLWNRKFIATFRSSKLEIILKQLELMGNIQYQLQGNTVIFKPGRRTG
ncbi:hypothetical protein A4H97_00150 [Niastella yeongjuensis]|uniref:FecR protein domain-containing protein n=1 Tax=Niastella yeongjuensis TaxID=354355 RepID=A0A1V9EWL8_9BACT|nr:FecR family protein [Niastella yeongjuensis]OQP50295.1 hypothetical protein A4H97_00150 [Niastella yeongjuensis]SEN40743.1 FecR family protein [Niastella yeongjuensis]